MIQEKNCPCGWVLKLDLSSPVLMSLPPKYLYTCSNCGKKEYFQEIIESNVRPQ